jgi:biopolymer transport protein ExbD
MTSIAEALVATAIGLLVAIPAVAATTRFSASPSRRWPTPRSLAHLARASQGRAGAGGGWLMAGGSPSDNGDDGIVGINVTPLVDITLVLLIIFMVRREDGRLPVGPPRSAESARRARTCRSSSRWSSTQRRHPGRPKEARQRRRAASARREGHAKTADLRAVIKADGTVQHQRVIHVLDLLKQAGIAKIAFGVTPIAPEPAAAPASSR